MDTSRLVIDERYSWDGHQLLYDGMARCSIHKLHNLMFVPDYLDAPRQKSWKARSDDVLTEQFLRAQLRLYGVWFACDSSHRMLMNTMRNALTGWELKKPGIYIKQVTAALKAHWEKEQHEKAKAQEDYYAKAEEGFYAEAETRPDFYDYAKIVREWEEKQERRQQMASDKA